MVTIPLVVAGPRLVDRALPKDLDFVNELYWPIVVVLCICFLATLYHVSVPVRTSWRYNLPGAALTMTIWIVGSYLLRWVLTGTAKGSTSIYGPLAAPIVVMLWLYILSIAVLIGAAVNAAFDRLWPEKETSRARMEIVRRLRLQAMIPRLRRDDEEQERFPDAADETMLLQKYDEGLPHDQETGALAATDAVDRPAGRTSAGPADVHDDRETSRPSRSAGSGTENARAAARGPPYIPGVLETIGYEPDMAEWAASADAHLARVVRVDRGLVSVLAESGPHRTGIGGALLARMAKDPTEGPCTGDWCVLREWPDHRLTLERLLPRRTAVVRATAGEQSHGQVLCANIDVAAVVVALHPTPSLAKVERLVTLAWESGARPLVVLTKADLVSDAAAHAEEVADAAPGVEVCVVSAVSGAGVASSATGSRDG